MRARQNFGNDVSVSRHPGQFRHNVPLLRVNELRTSFFTSDGEIRAVNGVSFGIDDGETVGLVGESGCGKSVTALSIIQLLDKGTGRIVGGEILYRGRNSLRLGEEEMRRIRGNEISMVFQEPMTSLNPVMTVGDQIAETVRVHKGAGRRAALDRAIEMLRLCRNSCSDLSQPIQTVCFSHVSCKLRAAGFASSV